MLPCFAIWFETPQKFLLNGLWFGSKKPKRIVIWVHGLGGSAFGKLGIVSHLAQEGTAVITFNNRGHDLVANVNTGGGKRLRAGAAHEVFAHCVDDIQGAVNFVRTQGVKDIYVAGHSTGCQKSIYWASQKKGKGIKGIILLAPVSDYAAALSRDTDGRLLKLTKVAQKMVAGGKKHDLMPGSVLNDGSLNDAQRFLSLNTPDSIETIFPYEQQGKRPLILQKIENPILVLWAGDDEYAGRPTGEIASWFDINVKSKHKVIIIPRAKHSFKGKEAQTAKAIKAFIQSQ